MRRLNKQYWPGRVVIKHRTDDDVVTMKNWLETRLPEREDWTLVYSLNDNQLDFYFRQESDAMMFSLKWGAG